jgi:bis(5'-nucleosyl)-tetraphosphatase (symmetrical)
MSIYAIGDVQGCYDELRRLIDKLSFDPDHDELWFVGDLVNRGPKSLKTLRFVRTLGKAAVTVLGNHDLHLLAASEDVRFVDESLDKILEADDADEIFEWLRQQPLAVYRPEFNTLMVHAGVYRSWDPLKTVKLAREVEKVLRSTKYPKFLANMYGDTPTRWSGDLEGYDRLRFITNCLTRTRYCREDGSLNFDQKGPPGSQPKGLEPWFELKDRKSKSVRIVFGHWSSLGLLERQNLLMIDTGCVWGRKLTAARLDGPLKTYSVKAES